ncbi:MAG: hypothetical protein NTX47_07435 [Candidatus Omnitrophica bacterium]|nr:hypothetical protein [Candidatus Omnitrophota bacterium]
MTFNTMKKVASIVTFISFIATNSIYAAPESKSVFKNKKVDYQKINDQNNGVIQRKKAILNGEDANQVESQQKEAQKILSSHLSDISLIHIPAELGRITEVYQNPDAENSRLIVHIQDLHTNPEAEYNLAKILELLLNDYKMGLVCSEGADGAVDTSSISSFPDYATREKVSKIFVNAGELTGEEYLSITKYPALPIWGIENKEIYFKNIIDFNKIMKFNPQSQVFISQAKKALEELKNKLYTKELLELDQKGLDYKAQKLESADYITYLTGYVQKLNIPTLKYENVSLLNETIDMEKRIGQLKIMNELQNLLLNLQAAFLSKSMKGESDSLNANAQLFKDQKISPFSFYSYLKDLANKHLKDEFSAKYTAINSFVTYLTKVNSLDSTKLFIELEDLNFEIKEALCRTEEQKTLVKALRNIDFLEGFFNLKVSNEELDYYLENKESHKVAWFKSAITGITGKIGLTGQTNYIDYNSALIDPHLTELEEFYKVVKERDVAMVDNSLFEIEKRRSKVSALIAGGFHTKGITRLLKDKGYSYIVVSPYSKTDMDEQNYHFLLSGKRKPLVELLKQLDLGGIVKRYITSTGLRVNMGCDTDMDAAFGRQVIPELAKIWDFEPEDLHRWNLPPRVVACLVFQSAAAGRTDFKGWPSIVGLELNDIGVLKLTSREGYIYYVEVTADNKVKEAKPDAFNNGTVVVNIPSAGTGQIIAKELQKVDLSAVEPEAAVGSLFNLLDLLIRLRDGQGITEISTGKLKTERTAVGVRMVDREINAGRLLGILEDKETSRGVVKFTEPFKDITRAELVEINTEIAKILPKGLGRGTLDQLDQVKLEQVRKIVETFKKVDGLRTQQGREAEFLVQNVQKLSRVDGGIVAGIGLQDIHGRVFKLNGQFFNDDGSYTEELQKFMDTLSDNSVQEMIHAGIMYYDIRSKYWKDNPAFTVAFAFAFAKKLQEIEGRQDGIVLHIGVDAYHKHFETAQVFADAILRTGICDNGGGIYYWGVINGGDTRNYGQLYHAMNNGKGGNWVYFTMSHVRDDFIGAKLGRGAKVYCGSEIRHCEDVTSGTLYDAIVEKDFTPVKRNIPVGNIVTVSNVIKNNIEVAADMIRATSDSSDIPTNELLKSEKAKFYVLMGGSPMAKNLVDMLKALGADIEVESGSVDKNFNTANIIDPNELNNPNAHPLQVAINKRLREIAKETGRTVLVVDPDADRGSIVAINEEGEAIALSGSKLLLLAMEPLARSYKAKGLPPPTVICDMRTGVSAKDLAKVLNERGFPIKVVPHEAGYPFFMRGMASLPADLAVENTTHAFMNPMTNPKWGAPEEYRMPNGEGYQGGDNAALFLIYLAGCMVHQWEGRTPAQQLEWLEQEYGIKKTIDDERKPKMPVKDDKYKYIIAGRMKMLAKQYCTDKTRFLINFDDPKVSLVSGVHLTNVKTGAMVLVRFSNTGSTFTISGEAYYRKDLGEGREREDLNEMLGLGYWIMITAVNQLHAEGNVFDFDPKDAAELENQPIVAEMNQMLTDTQHEGLQPAITKISRDIGSGI